MTDALNYLTIDELIDYIDEPWRTGCTNLLTDNRSLFEKARGSTHNHQAWEGGYIDHVTDGMNFGRHLYLFIMSFGRTLPFSLSDVLLIFFLHDVEKPWRIEIGPDGEVRNRSGLSTKEEFKNFREAKLDEYQIYLTPYQRNALTYVEGEYTDYSSLRRVMNELASFCHLVDNWSARGWYDYPKATDDEWVGARRFRTK